MTNATDEMVLSVLGTPDPQLVTSDWMPTADGEIDGVFAKQVANVLTDNGYLTELWRSDWLLDGGPVDQVFQRVMQPATISAWHVHLRTTDRLSCAIGQLLVVLYDARAASPTHGAIAQFRFGERRPAVISVPPGVYHGVRNIGTTSAVLVNAVDAAYDYDAPDHHRLPPDCADIPYQW